MKRGDRVRVDRPPSPNHVDPLQGRRGTVERVDDPWVRVRMDHVQGMRMIHIRQLEVEAS